MMMSTEIHIPHATDGELMAILDHELVDPDVRGHVAHCAHCARRLATYESASIDLERAFAATPIAPVTRQRVAPRLPLRRAARWTSLAAAAAVFTVASVALAALVREWRSDAVRAREATAPAPVATSAPARPAPPSGTIVSFAVGASELDVRVGSDQPSGTLQLVPSDSALASARIVDGDQETLVVLPGSVRFTNDAASRASYRVTVPRNVERVTLYIGTRRQVIERSELPSTLSLARR